ncbi:MAG: 3-phosphoshikimate 1-carboxyvinyltransferase [Lachnospiraceae bacterium]|nr:3-phosphoshikimate 1-carboxyvinyltransferase [Lachnospiraceae bacterium]
MRYSFNNVPSLRGTISVPGDKSISHRCILLGSLSKGITSVKGFLDSADCRSTISCMKKMGISIEQNESNVNIKGHGLRGLSAPTETLYTGNSGTTTRIMSGILCGQRFSCRVTGDESIEKRPMKRVIDPLSLMGASIRSEKDNGCAPLLIEGSDITGKSLHGINYTSPVASAQVKSAVLFAGMYADSPTTVTEPALSRDHTERMAAAFGATIKRDGLSVTIEPSPLLLATDVEVPGDISSAAYFIAAALIHKNAELYIKNVNINPTRAGILEVVKLMGGNIHYENKRICSGEEVCDLLIKSSDLHGCEISGAMIPTLIDEIPVIAVMAAAASGTTTIKDASELRVKESDRIASVCENLSALGADITPTEDGMIINGGQPLSGVRIHTYKDHRIAMSMAVASLLTGDEVTFDDPSCVDISYPTFFKTLNSVCEQ